MNQRQRVQLFQAYWQQRVSEAQAITPGQKKALIEQLRREAKGETDRPGYLRMPRIGGRTILLPVNHPLIAAALEGRRVSMGGALVEAEQPVSIGGRAQNLSTPQKIALLAGGLLAFMLLMCGFMSMLSGGKERALAAAPTASTTPSATPDPSPSPSATATAIAATPVVEATPTSYAIALGTLGGEAAPNGNDPASIEVAGYSYVLAAGGIKNGQWQPVGAEWLAGTHLRRVVTVPWEPEVAEAIAALRPGEVLRMRLRSGEIVKYRVTEVQRQQRQQIEVLAARTPSLALVLHGEPAAERWVVIAEAVQEPQDFTVYTAAPEGGAGVGSAPPSGAAVPTLTPSIPTTPTEEETIITDTQTITNTAVGLVLTVTGCTRAEQIGEQEPPNKQDFLLCDVRFTALPGSGNVAFSAESLAVTEEEWITANVDWWPPSVAVTRALRSGTLSPGNSTSGRIAGTVLRASSSPIRRSNSRPVVVWEQAGLRYLIQVTAPAP